MRLMKGSPKKMKTIISTFPDSLVNISKCHNEEINPDTEDMKYMLIAPKHEEKYTLNHCQRSNFEECTEEN